MNNKTSEIIANWFERKYAEVDQLMVPFSTNCKRSCDWCCYQSIEILNWEKPLIINYISEKLSDNKKRIVKQNLTFWLNYFNQMVPSNAILSVDDVFVKFQQQQGKDRIACPFLHQHECVIYPVRPLSCRMHVAENGPIACRANPLNDASPNAVILRKNILKEIVDAVPTQLELLNLAVAYTFGLSHMVRHIECAILKSSE